MRSTTGCARPGRSSTPHSAWNSSASPDSSCRKASRRCARSARRDFRPTASSETAGDNDALSMVEQAAPRPIQERWQLTPSAKEKQECPNQNNPTMTPINVFTEGSGMSGGGCPDELSTAVQGRLLDTCWTPKGDNQPNLCNYLRSLGDFEPLFSP